MREAVGVLCIITNFAVKKLHTILLMNFKEHFCISFKSFVRYFNKSSYTALVLQVLPFTIITFMPFSLKGLNELLHLSSQSSDTFKMTVLTDVSCKLYLDLYRKEKNFLNNSNQNP